MGAAEGPGTCDPAGGLGRRFVFEPEGMCGRRVVHQRFARRRDADGSVERIAGVQDSGGVPIQNDENAGSGQSGKALQRAGAKPIEEKIGQ